MYMYYLLGYKLVGKQDFFGTMSSKDGTNGDTKASGRRSLFLSLSLSLSLSFSIPEVRNAIALSITSLT